jgi:hypothetical protein
VAYFKAAEESRYIRDGAGDDAELARAIETLRKMDTTPLMIDLPDETAYELWNRAGSWAGALTLAGLEPLDEARRHEAAKLYSITHASPKRISKKFLPQISKETYKMLEQACELARRLERCPTKDELPKELSAKLRADNCEPEAIFRQMGLAQTFKDEAPKKKSKKGAVTLKKIERFRNSSYWWRNTKKYKALARGEKPQPRTQNAQTQKTHKDSAEEK